MNIFWNEKKVIKQSEIFVDLDELKYRKLFDQVKNLIFLQLWNYNLKIESI